MGVAALKERSGQTAIVEVIEDRDREIYRALLLDDSFPLQSRPSLQSIVPKLLNTPALHFRLRIFCPIEVKPNGTYLAGSVCSRCR